MKCTLLPHDTTRVKPQSLWSLLESLHTQSESMKKKKERCSRVKSSVKKIFSSLQQQKEKVNQLFVHQLGRNENKAIKSIKFHS